MNIDPEFKWETVDDSVNPEIVLLVGKKYIEIHPEAYNYLVKKHNSCIDLIAAFDGKYDPKFEMMSDYEEDSPKDVQPEEGSTAS